MNQKYAFYNTNMAWEDGSAGVHNPSFIVQMLQRSYFGVYGRPIEQGLSGSEAARSLGLGDSNTDAHGNGYPDFDADSEPPDANRDTGSRGYKHTGACRYRGYPLRLRRPRRFHHPLSP